MGANVAGVRLWGVFTSAVPVTITGTTSEVELMRLVIPAGVMGANGWMRINYQLSYTANANTKTIRVGINGGSSITHTRTGGTVAMDNVEATVRNRNSTNAQIWASAVSSLSSQVGIQPLSSQDTENEFNLTIRGQLANAADSITLESWSVEVFD